VTAVAGRTSAWRRSSQVMSRVTPRSVLLALPAGDAPVKLEGAAAFVWYALEVPATEGTLVATLAMRFATTPAKVRSDVAVALDQLAALRVIVASHD
jgi:hypothetical protein